MRNKIILFIAWILGIKKEFDVNSIKKDLQNESDTYFKEIIKLKQDLKDIIEAETNKSEKKEEVQINYIHIEQELKPKIIKSEVIVNELSEDEEIDALNDLLIKLLPYISNTKLTTTENSNITIINKITILTNKE